MVLWITHVAAMDGSIEREKGNPSVYASESTEAPDSNERRAELLVYARTFVTTYCRRVEYASQSEDRQ